MAVQARYRFGPFSLDPATRRLLRETEQVPLSPKAFDLLVLLVVNRSRVVSKQELLDAVWEDTAVVENSLTQRIKELRTALSDPAHKPRYLRTVSRVGYQFVEEVVEDAETALSRGTEHPPPYQPADLRSPAPRRSMVFGAAVLLLGFAAALAIWLATRSDASSSADPRHRLVSTFDGEHRSASFSPDGRLIAFVMDVDGVPQVWIKSIDSGAPVQLTSGEVPAGRPRWSPRGDQILFERRLHGIWSIPPLGGEARQLIPDGRSPAFSADGSTIVFERGGTLVPWGIWHARADGSQARRVEGTPEKVLWTEPAAPSLSPDGQWVAFFRHTEGPRGDLWVVRAEGGGARQITHDESEGGAPVWTRDGHAVIFASHRRGSRTLWKVTIASESIEPQTAGAGSDDEPEISLDGRQLIYTNYKDRHAIALWDPSSGRSTTLLERAVPLFLPSLSPRGDRVAYFMPVGADIQIFTIGLDGRGPRQVTYGDGQENLHPSWSPDSRFIYYYRHKPEPGWRRIGADGDGDVEIVPGWRSDTHQSPTIDGTGRYVLYTKVGYDTGDYSKDTTYIHDLKHGTARALAPPHMHSARWSPDDRHATGWLHDGSVGVCEADTGRCRTLTQGVRSRWSTDGSAVYVQRNVTSTHGDLWRVAVADGAERLLGRVGPFHPLSPNVDVTPDGRVVYARFEMGRRELWTRDLR